MHREAAKQLRAAITPTHQVALATHVKLWGPSTLNMLLLNFAPKH